MDKRVTREAEDRATKVLIENPAGTKQISFDAPAKRVDLRTIQTGLGISSTIALKNMETGTVTQMSQGTVYFADLPAGCYVTCTPPSTYKVKKTSIMCAIL